MKNTCRFLLAFVSLFAAHGIAQADLIAHFPLDDNAESSDGNFEGTHGDDVSFSPDGVFGGAAEFEGFEGIVVDYDEDLTPQESFTVTAWVNPSDTVSWNSVVTSRSHFDFGDGTVITGYIIYNTPENDWDFWTGGGGASGTWGRDIGPQAELDEWQHLAITYDEPNDIKTLYVNGEEEAVAEGQGYVPNPNQPLLIGSGDDVGNDFFFVGLIDDLSIWDESLDQESIQCLMTEGIAGCDPSGLAGDFNVDGVLDEKDINALTGEILAGGMAPIFDVNSDGTVDGEDRMVWVNELKGTYLGDSNLDLEFGSGDLVQVFTAGEYEDGIPLNSGWESGDWNGDGDFGSGDLVAAFTVGAFELGPRQAANAVPEPGSLALLVVGMLGLTFSLRRRSK